MARKRPAVVIELYDNDGNLVSPEPTLEPEPMGPLTCPVLWIGDTMWVQLPTSEARVQVRIKVVAKVHTKW